VEFFVFHETRVKITHSRFPEFSTAN